MGVFKRSEQESADSPEDDDIPTFFDFDGPGKVTAMEQLGRWLVLLIALGLGLWLTWVMAASFLPRWWGQRVGQQVDGSFTAGITWGFGLGFFATTLSLLVLIQVRRRFLAWWGKIIVALLAVALSAPNLMTLAVTIGTNNAAHAGQRIFDVNAPGFQWASLLGVITAAVVFLLLLLLVWTSRRNKRKVADLKSQVESSKREKSAKQADDSARDFAADSDSE